MSPIVSLPFPLATLLTIIAAIAYGLLTWQVLRQIARQSPSRLARHVAAGKPSATPAGLSPALLGFAIAVHGTALYLDMFGEGTVRFSFALTVSVILWLAVVLHGFESLAYKQRGLLALILPVATAGVLLPLIFPVEHPLIHIDAWLFRH